MKVLILNWRDIHHPLAGGAEISLMEHAKYWAKQGASIAWYSSGYDNCKKEETIEKIKVIRKGNHYTVALLFFLDWLKGNYRDFDVVVDSFHFFPYFTPLYMKIKKIGLINEVAGRIWFQNLPYPLAIIGYLVEPYIFKTIYRNIQFITASNSTKEDLMSVGIKSKNINIIPHGIYPLQRDLSIKKETNPTILFLGRLSRDKGILDALEMLRIILEKNKSVRLWVVGRVESEKFSREIRQLAKKNKLNKNCKFFGYVDEKQKTILMQKAWLLIHPSIKEGWGLNVIEANSVGLPAIGYNVSGLKDSIRNNKTGLLVEPTTEGMLVGIEKLLRDRKIRHKLGIEAIKWAKGFDWGISGKKSWEVIKNV